MIQTQIKERIISAMKERTDEGKLLAGVLKNIKGKIENEAKIKKVEILDDKDSEKIIQKYVKERKESLSVAIEADRPDLAEKEQFEIDTFSEYLPQVLSEDETRAIVQGIVDGGANNIGMIMGKLGQYGNTLDKGLASKIAKELLGIG
jgi:uncharacterized protein YqeY